MSKDQLYIFDTTLRDGAQTQGVDFSVDDKVKITISPSALASDEIIFYIPQIVPGTYEYSNFGRFAEDLKAFDSKGNSLTVTAIDQNSWKIEGAKKLQRITYWVNDTFDGPDGSEIYPMGGTSFDTDKKTRARAKQESSFQTFSQSSSSSELERTIAIP